MVVQSKIPFGAIIGVLTPFPGALLGSIITKRNIPNWYENKLIKPTWRPPNWVFPPVWTTLYISMGYASYLVWRDGGGFDGSAKIPLLLYGTQLALNWSWTPIFFGLKSIKWGLVTILALDAGVIATMSSFYGINKHAFCLMVPYLSWSIFATFLMKWIYNNNKEDTHVD